MSRHRKSKMEYNMNNLNIALKDEQIDAREMIDNHAVTILWGKAGCGKTLVAVYSALDLLMKKEVERVIITRPTVSDEDIGFLPGGVEEKMEPWMAPIYGNMELAIGHESTKFFTDKKVVQIKPLSYMRGQTFTDSAIIVDEAQNVTHKQMEMLLSRLGRRSRMMICGDMKQRDLKGRSKSGFPFLLTLSKKLDQVADMELKVNHRHSVVQDILDLYDKR